MEGTSIILDTMSLGCSIRPGLRAQEEMERGVRTCQSHRTVSSQTSSQWFRNFALEMRSDSFFLFLDFVCLLSGRSMGHREGSEWSAENILVKDEPHSWSWTALNLSSRKLGTSYISVSKPGTSEKKEKKKKSTFFIEHFLYSYYM